MHSEVDAPASGLSRRAILALSAGSALTLAAMPRQAFERLDALLPDNATEAQDVDARGIMMAAPATGVVPCRLQHAVQHAPAVLAQWDEFKRRFTVPDGRVCDTGNGGVSHSEGQGWGMLLAAAFNDRAFFDTLRDWTRRNLQIRSDALHAWRFMPQSAVPVADHNNATDGDLFIASALWRAAWRWNAPDYAQSAAEIARDILRVVVRDVGGRSVLLPGAVGFEQQSSVTINPSYYVIPAIEELALLCPSSRWQDVLRCGRDILTEGRYGPFRLPPDWLSVDRRTGVLRPDMSRPNRFSYDAIRVPLWLSWARAGLVDLEQDFLAYWQRFQPQPPAWIDLSTNQLASYPAPAGMLAIGQIASVLSGRPGKSPQPTTLPALSASLDYYSAAITLLSHCALQEASLA